MGSHDEGCLLGGTGRCPTSPHSLEGRDRRLRDLEVANKHFSDEINWLRQALRSATTTAGRSPFAADNPTYESSQRQTPVQSTPLATAPPRANGAQPRPPTLCFGCGLPGHRIRDCTNKPKTASGAGQARSQSSVYVAFNVCGTSYNCLLDTGCERSLVPRKLVPNATLKPTDTNVYAANNTKIPILGSVRLCFRF